MVKFPMLFNFVFHIINISIFTYMSQFIQDTIKHCKKLSEITKNLENKTKLNGNFVFKATLSVDAMSLFTAIAAHTVKIPSEKNLAIHLFWLRELLDRKVIQYLEWCDTRDMSADCHTKGSIERDVILALMLGELEYHHEAKPYPP